MEMVLREVGRATQLTRIVSWFLILSSVSFDKTIGPMRGRRYSLGLTL